MNENDPLRGSPNEEPGPPTPESSATPSGPTIPPPNEPIQVPATPLGKVPESEGIKKPEEAGGDFKKALGDVEREEKEEEFEEKSDVTDLSQTLSREEIHGVELDDGSVRKWCKKLREERLLVLESWDCLVLHGAAQSIAFLSTWPEMDRRYVEITEATESLQLKAIVERGPSTLKRDRVIVIYETMPQGISILHSNSNWYSPPSLATFRESLRKNRTYLLVVVFSGLLRKNRRDYDRNILFTECKQAVDFVLPRLKASYGDGASDYQEKLLEQRTERLWSQDDEEFQEELVAAIHRGTFEKEVESSSERRTQVVRQERVDPAGFLPTTTLFERAVIWIATFLPRLPVRDFEHAMKVLVGGPKPGTSDYHALWDEWEKDPNAVLEKCHLAIQELPRQSPCVGFQRSSLGAVFQRMFVEKFRFQHERFFERIETARLLLSNRESLRRSAAVLLAQRCLQELDDFTSTLLNRAIGLLVDPPVTAPIPDDLMNALPAEQKRAIRSALGYLLQRLIQEGGGDAATRMLVNMAVPGGWQTSFELLKQSRPADFPDKNLLQVLTPFLQRGKEPLPDRARRVLWKVVSRERGRMEEVLRILSDILPDPVAVEWVAFACVRHIEGLKDRKDDPVLHVVLEDTKTESGLSRRFFDYLATTGFDDALEKQNPFNKDLRRFDLLSYWLLPYRELSKLDMEPALVYLSAQLSMRRLIWTHIEQLPEQYNLEPGDLFRAILMGNWIYEAALRGENLDCNIDRFVDSLGQVNKKRLMSMRRAAELLSEMLGEALNTGMGSISSSKMAYAAKSSMTERWKGLRKSLGEVQRKLGPMPA